MNLNELIKEQQERNREETAKAIYDQFTYNGEGEKPNWVENGNSLKQDEARRMTNKLNIDQATQQTAEAVRDWMVEEIRPFVERVRLDVDVIICDCGEKYKDSDLDLSVGELEKEISQLQAN